MIPRFIQLMFSPAVPLIMLGLAFFILGWLIFAFPELLAYFVAIFLLMQGGFFVLLGLYFWISGRRPPHSRNRNDHYYEVHIED